MTIELLSIHREKISRRPQKVAPQICPLVCLLADTQLVAMQTAAVRWTLRGPRVDAIRTVLYYHGRELSRAIDEVGERIRMLGGTPPFSTRLHDAYGSVADLETTGEISDLLRQLTAAHVATKRSAGSVIKAAADAGDDLSVNLARKRRLSHERMRRSLLHPVGGELFTGP